MIASQGNYGMGGDGHMHEPEPGPHTGDVRCRLCGVPLRALPLDMKRGYGGVAAGVNGVVADNTMRPITKDDLLDRIQNRHDRRKRKALARKQRGS
jgi:hypothetical protein